MDIIEKHNDIIIVKHEGDYYVTCEQNYSSRYEMYFITDTHYYKTLDEAREAAGIDQHDHYYS